jgi:hypothetical protein
MQADFNLQEQDPKDRRSGFRNAAGFLLIAIGIGVALLFFEVQDDTRVADDPALEALLKAQSRLAQSYGPEQDTLSQSQVAHRELKAAIDMLAAAERADPETTEKIAELRTSLKALESQKDFEGMTSKELQARYRKLRTELEALIKGHLERRH